MSLTMAPSRELTSPRFERLVKRTIEDLGYPLLGVPEPEAKRIRAEAMAALQIHRRCPFCGQLPSHNKPRAHPSSGSICTDCQKSSERRKRYGCW